MLPKLLFFQMHVILILLMGMSHKHTQRRVEWHLKCSNSNINFSWWVTLSS